MKDFIALLVQQSKSDKVRVDGDLDGALSSLDHMMDGICADLQVEYFGPFVGVETPEAHQLVVRAHEWRIHQFLWGLKVCSAAPQANYRAEWAVQGSGRLRKQLIVKVLPAFFAGFAEAVRKAGKADLPAGKRVLDLAQRFTAG